jgi:hypothetical protein
VGLNQKGINKKLYALKKLQMEINQPNNVKPKMRGCKLRGGVNWQGTLS